MLFRTVLFFSSFLLPVYVFGLSQTLIFTEDDLQQRLNEITPIQRKTVYANIVVTDATIQLLEGLNQLAITAFLDVTSFGGLHGSGKISVQGSLAYNADEGAFYLRRAKLKDLHIVKLNPELVLQLKPLIEDVIIQTIGKQPIYRLNDNDIRQSLIKTTLKDIQIHDKQVRVLFGF